MISAVESTRLRRIDKPLTSNTQTTRQPQIGMIESCAEAAAQLGEQNHDIMIPLALVKQKPWNR